MKKIIPTLQNWPDTKPEIPDIPASDISIARLIDDGLVVLYREIRNLMIKSAKGKLEPTDARDLRDSLKLLFELKDRENESLKSITDEELIVRAKEALDGK